jgi:hypothetical protein
VKRKDLIRAIQFAGYHNDSSAATRLLLQNVGKVSYQVWSEAFKQGQRAKVNGARCNCSACQKEGWE